LLRANKAGEFAPEEHAFMPSWSEENEFLPYVDGDFTAEELLAAPTLSPPLTLSRMSTERRASKSFSLHTVVFYHVKTHSVTNKSKKFVHFLRINFLVNTLVQFQIPSVFQHGVAFSARKIAW
jgi:hypothetical protein